MLRLYAQTAISCAVIACLPSGDLFAAAGTTTVASKGRETYVKPHWPDGVAAIVNDPARTSGWNNWFSEWPNDVNQYAFEIASTDDLNRLIAKLAAVNSELRQIHLSPLKEPEHLGGTHHLPKGNGISVIFSIGDQVQIDEWYKHVRKPFGMIEFDGVPVAVPPSLTIFVQHKWCKLDEIKIPAGISVSAGYVPMGFYRSNFKSDQSEKEKPLPLKKSSTEPLDEKTRAATERIKTFLKARDDVME